MDPSFIRNFSIIAHIDHGKSTLADRFLEKAGLLKKGLSQALDTMDLEKEKGITIKSRTCTLKVGSYQFNLIDTPGHVDFSYEVSRCLAACEGVLLLVDATQGIQAQTLAHFYKALELDLKVIPVINKIDLPYAKLEETRTSLIKELGFEKNDILKISAKSGEGISELTSEIIKKIPPPRPEAQARALIFDCQYDSYKGAVVLVRIFGGTYKPGKKIRVMRQNKEYTLEEVGTMGLIFTKTRQLGPGQVGYFIANIKSVKEARVGDTITLKENPANSPLVGYQMPLPYVFSSFFPLETNHFEALEKAISRLSLNDSSLHYEPDTSTALGFGFRMGFLGLLHLEITRERIEREFGVSVLSSAPSVGYTLLLKNQEERHITNPRDFPMDGSVGTVLEPYIRATIVTPTEYLGNIYSLLTEKRGRQVQLTYLSSNRVELVYELPFNEVLFDFYNKLKSLSRGYATFEYEFIKPKEGTLVRMDILINGQAIDAFSMIVPRQKAEGRGRALVAKLKTFIPRQLFSVPLQAAIGSKILARETIPALRKDVTAKCYGGDITRKRKLLEKQKEGKKKMKRLGHVDIPPQAFLSILKLDS